MSPPEIMSKIFEVIIEAIQADCFELVAFDYRQQPFFSQSKGREPAVPEKDRSDLINRALKSGQPVVSHLDHGQDILVACHPYFFQGKVYGYAYFEKPNKGNSSPQEEMEILSSALPAVKLLSQEAALPHQLPPCRRSSFSARKPLYLTSFRLKMMKGSSNFSVSVRRRGLSGSSSIRSKISTHRFSSAGKVEPAKNSSPD